MDKMTFLFHLHPNLLSFLLSHSFLTFHYTISFLFVHISHSHRYKYIPYKSLSLYHLHVDIYILFTTKSKEKHTYICSFSLDMQHIFFVSLCFSLHNICHKFLLYLCTSFSPFYLYHNFFSLPVCLTLINFLCFFLSRFLLVHCVTNFVCPCLSVFRSLCIS